MIKIEATKDFEILAKLNESVQNWHHKNFPLEFKKYNFEETKAFFKSVLEKEEVFCFLALKNKEAVGFIYFYLINKNENAFQPKREFIHIDQIAVKENFQKLGIGKLLMQKVEEIALQKKISEIKLDFWEKNENAKRFFEKDGYNCFNYKVVKQLKK